MEGKTLAGAVGAAGAAVIALGSFLLHIGVPPPAPERPAPPPPPEVLMNSVLKYSQPVWLALIESDAKRFKVAAPSLQELAAPIAYFEELSSPRTLKASASFETAHLRFALEVSRRKASMDGQMYSADHLVLRIENRTAKHLAYRVRTHVTDADRCEAKGDIAHNALVLEPKAALTRSECLYRRDETIDVTRVEVMELPALAAYYVSRLPPNPTLYDPRTSSGHVSLAGDVCPQTFSWREIQEGIDLRQIGWRDVVDFYGRHNCDEYSFFKGYRHRTDPAAPLPARPLD